MGDDASYQIGKHIYAMLMDEYGASKGCVDLWNLFRRMVDQTSFVFGKALLLLMNEH